MLELKGSRAGLEVYGNGGGVETMGEEITLLKEKTQQELFSPLFKPLLTLASVARSLLVTWPHDCGP